MNKFFFIATMLFLSSSAFALSIEEPLANPKQEAKAREIFQELRCVVCQSESIADSPAPVAADMRREIRTQVTANKSHDAIITMFTKRYGDFVLMRPPLHKNTALLWFAPIITILLGGILTAIYFFRKDTRL
jgi:cytochrome c-type biogenesis protein CcmH